MDKYIHIFSTFIFSGFNKTACFGFAENIVCSCSEILLLFLCKRKRNITAVLRTVFRSNFFYICFCFFNCPFISNLFSVFYRVEFFKKACITWRKINTFLHGYAIFRIFAVCLIWITDGYASCICSVGTHIHYHIVYRGYCFVSRSVRVGWKKFKKICYVYKTVIKVWTICTEIFYIITVSYRFRVGIAIKVTINIFKKCIELIFSGLIFI